MSEKGSVKKEDYEEFVKILKERMPEWLEKMEEYDSMAIDW